VAEFGLIAKLDLLFHTHENGRRKQLLKDEIMNVSNTQVQMRKGILECCILHIISRGEVYASDLMEELKGANLIIVEGTLYPLLNRLKNAGLVTYRWVESDAGPPRKYYIITDAGKGFLAELADTWEKLHVSVNSILAIHASKSQTSDK